MSKKFNKKELKEALKVITDELKSIKAQMAYTQAMQGTNSINACKDCILRNGSVEAPRITWTSGSNEKVAINNDKEEE